MSDTPALTADPIDTAFVAIQLWCDDFDGTDEDLRAIIATAIREAEKAEREECADVADHALHGVSLASVDSVFAEGMLEGISLAARLIRAHATPLKSQES